MSLGKRQWSFEISQLCKGLRWQVQSETHHALSAGNHSHCWCCSPWTPCPPPAPTWSSSWFCSSTRSLLKLFTTPLLSHASAVQDFKDGFSSFYQKGKDQDKEPVFQSKLTPLYVRFDIGKLSSFSCCSWYRQSATPRWIEWNPFVHCQTTILSCCREGL